MIRSADLRSHYDEMVHFLMGCTIKNDALIRSQNRDLEARGYAVADDPTTWKYWMNVRGLYHVSDWVPHPVTGVQGDVHVKSLDRPDTWVSFTPDSLARNSVTRSEYEIHRPAFRRLLAAYPGHADILKNAILPVSENGLEDAMAAPHLSLIRFPGSDPDRPETTYLETTELAAVIQDLRAFLDYVRERWYKNWLARIEPAYDAVFWGNLWQHLLARISVSRIENMNTAQAASFHVWEYLKSTGIGDYRDVLTNRQALFLYRNIRHILDNRGRQSNLRLLINDLLREESVAITSKVVYQETETLKEKCEWRTEFVSEPVETGRQIVRDVREPQDVDTVIRQIFNSGAETRVDAPYVETMRRRLAATTFNRYPTKLLEIESFRRDSQHRIMFFNLFMDTLVYFIQNNLIRERVVLRDAETDITLSLDPKDMLLLMGYASRRVLVPDATPFTTPAIYTVFEGPFLHNVVEENLPTEITYRGRTELITRYICPAGGYATSAASPESLLEARRLYLEPVHDVFRPDGNPIFEFFFTGSLASPRTHFTDVLGRLFQVLLRRRREIRMLSSGREIFARKILLAESQWDDRLMPLTLTAHPTYAEWLADPGNGDIRTLVQTYDSRSNFQDLYYALFHRFLQRVLDYRHPRVRDHISVEGETQRFVGRLRDLFIQLCSYNVLFLDTGDDDVVLWTYVPVTRFDAGGIQVSSQQTRILDILITKRKSVIRQDVRSDVAPFDVTYDSLVFRKDTEIPIALTVRKAKRISRRKRYVDPIPRLSYPTITIKRASRVSVTADVVRHTRTVTA